MSIAYLDPGNIESDLQSGAVAGFKVSAKTTEEALGALWPMWPRGRQRDSGGDVLSWKHTGGGEGESEALGCPLQRRLLRLDP